MTGWQLSRAQRSWTWPGSEGETAEIEVYARAARVELFVNGESVGKKKPRKGIARFRTAYVPGELLVISYDAMGQEFGRDSLKTAGEGLELRLACETESASPGEMVYFRVRYTDEAGEIKPTEKHSVRIEAENGSVMGTANGSCSFRGNFAQSEAPTYFGEMQTVVQAGESGILRVTAWDGERRATSEIPIVGKG